VVGKTCSIDLFVKNRLIVEPTTLVDPTSGIAEQIKRE